MNKGETKLSNKQTSSASNTIDFSEQDDIHTLSVWGYANIFIGILLVVVGLVVGFSQLSSYYGFPIPFFVIAAIGLVMVNSGFLFVVLSKLGAGIAYRIGRHLAVRLPIDELLATQVTSPNSTISSKPKGDFISCRSCDGWSERKGPDGYDRETCSSCGAGKSFLNFDS